MKMLPQISTLLSMIMLWVGSFLCSPIIHKTANAEGLLATDVNHLDDVNKEPSKEAIDLSSYGLAMFGEPDKDTVKLVAAYAANISDVNPEELGSYLEGDILTPKHIDVTTKNGITTQSSRWPKGIVPFVISGIFNAQDMSIIEYALTEYHRRTCIRFVPRTAEKDYISIVSGNSGCWSSVGRIGGKQEVNLQSPGCLTKPGTAIHELMHALGFLHEQNREERDSFVKIRYENVQPKAVANFARARKTLAFGVPYDYGSVMHYSANAFSTNGRPTIEPLRSTAGAKMGQRDGFSVKDVAKLNQMYNCGYAAAPPPVPIPINQPGIAGLDNSLVNSFVSGVISGLGFGDHASPF